MTKINLKDKEGNVVYPTTLSSQVKFSNGDNLDTKITEIDNKADQALQQAVNGRKVIAQAVSGKGISADETDTFEVLADKITQISSGGGLNTVPGRSYDLVALPINRDTSSAMQLYTGLATITGGLRFYIIFEDDNARPRDVFMTVRVQRGFQYIINETVEASGSGYTLTTTYNSENILEPKDLITVMVGYKTSIPQNSGCSLRFSIKCDLV